MIDETSGGTLIEKTLTPALVLIFNIIEILNNARMFVGYVLASVQNRTSNSGQVQISYPTSTNMV